MHIVCSLCLLDRHLSQQQASIVPRLQAQWHSRALRLLMFVIDCHRLLIVLIQFRICFLQLTHILLEHLVYLHLILLMQLLIASFEAVGTVSEHVAGGLLLVSIAVQWVAAGANRLPGGRRGSIRFFLVCHFVLLGLAHGV